MTEARIGWGGKFYLSTNNTEAGLVQLSEVREVGFPQDEADEHEVTHLLSPGRRKEFIQGLIDGGEFTATFNYVPGSTTDLALTDAKDTGTIRKVRIVIPDDSGTGAADWNMVTSAFVKKYAPDNMEANAPIQATATFRVTGALEQGTGAAGS
jgi:hypothetical protein